MTEPGKVRACAPPALAVMVDGEKVKIQEPHELMPRVDLVVRETRCDQEEATVRALMGVPSYQALAPALTWNSAVRQEPLAYVQVRRQQWVVQDCDIEPVSGWLPPAVD